MRTEVKIIQGERVKGINSRNTKERAPRKLRKNSGHKKIQSDRCPVSAWAHEYTDGSAKNAIENGGGGIVLNLKNGINKTINCNWKILK